MSNNFIVDTEINTTHVLFGISALARNGLITYNTLYLSMFTEIELNTTNYGLVSYYYNSSIDYSNYLTPMSTNPMLLLPTKERAIVEYIIFEEYRDEGVLIEAISSYLLFEDNLAKLYEVSDFYKLDRETLEYWLHEAREDGGDC